LTVKKSLLPELQFHLLIILYTGMKVTKFALLAQSFKLPGRSSLLRRGSSVLVCDFVNLRTYAIYYQLIWNARF